MNKLNKMFERFQTETIKEFRTKYFFVSIEKVRDTMLRKIWYNVIWGYIPDNTTPPEKMFKFKFLIKSKSYQTQEDAIQHFNNTIKSQLL